MHAALRGLGGEGAGVLMRDESNGAPRLEGWSAGGWRDPAVADDARPATSQRQYAGWALMMGGLEGLKTGLIMPGYLRTFASRYTGTDWCWGFLRTIETVPVSWASIPSDDYMRSASISLRCTALSFDTLLLTAPELTSCDRQTAQDVCRVKDASSSHI